MLKKIGIPILTLAAMLILIPAPQAKAGVRLGVYVGGPAYVAPAPVYPYAYPAPGYYPAYPYPAPVYVAPYVNWGRGGHVYVGGPGRVVGHAFVGRGFRGRR
jgi:hypothetical protein